MFVSFFSPRVEGMFLQLKEVHEKVFYIKESLFSLDSQLGHLQDLSALTVDTLKVISAVDTLQVEKALLSHPKYHTCRKLPHSWSNAIYSKTLSSLECLSDKKYNYYSMPPSLLRSLARSQWPSEHCSHIFQSEDFEEAKKGGNQQKQEMESDTLTSGVSSEMKSAPRCGQFLLVPSGQQGPAVSEEVHLNLSLPCTPAKYKEQKLVTKQHRNNVLLKNSQDAKLTEQKLERYQTKQWDSIIQVSAEEDNGIVMDHSLSLEPSPIASDTLLPSCTYTKDDRVGYVNWGFSEGDEKGVFIHEKKQQSCMHSTYNSDCNCTSNQPQHVQIKESKSFSYNLDKSGYSSDTPVSQLRHSTSFWINPLRRNWSFYKGSSFQSCKEQKVEKTCKIKGNNNVIPQYHLLLETS